VWKTKKMNQIKLNPIKEAEYMKPTKKTQQIIISFNEKQTNKREKFLFNVQMRGGRIINSVKNQFISIVIQSFPIGSVRVF